MKRLFLFVLLISYQLYSGIGIGYSNPTPLPVQLISFSASITPDGVSLHWTTSTEINNYGFEIERTLKPDEGGWEKIGFVNGSGNSNSLKEYSFTDPLILDLNLSLNHKPHYRLKQIDNNGTFRYSPVIEAGGVYEFSYQLDQNYPNPFNPATLIAFRIPAKSLVTLKVYDMLGREVATLVNLELEAGQYSARFDGSGYSSGIYFYEVIAGEYRSIKKMTLMK